MPRNVSNRVRNCEKKIINLEQRPNNNRQFIDNVDDNTDQYNSNNSIQGTPIIATDQQLLKEQEEEIMT